MTTRALLDRHPLFAKLSAEALETLARDATLVRIDTGETLPKPAPAAYLVTRGAVHTPHGTVTDGDLFTVTNADETAEYALTSCSLLSFSDAVAPLLLSVQPQNVEVAAAHHDGWPETTSLAFATVLQLTYAALEVAPWLIISPIVDRCLLYRDVSLWPTLLAALLILATFAVGANAVHGILITPIATSWATAIRRRTIGSIFYSVATPHITPSLDRWWQRLRTTLRAIDQLQQHGALWVHESCRATLCIVLAVCLAGKLTMLGLVALVPLVLWRLLSGHSQVHAAHEMFVIQLLCTIHGLLVLAIGVQQARTGHLSIGHLVAVLGLWLTAWDSSMHVLPLRSLPGTLRRRGSVRGAPTGLVVPRAHAQFSNVSVVYPGSATPALREFSLRLAPGLAVGLVGRSGAGKSTLARLLHGVIAPTQGEVTLDGRAPQQWTPVARRDHVAWLDDKPFLLHGTLRDNLVRSAPPTALARMSWACEIAGIAPDELLLRAHPISHKPVPEALRARVLLARILMRRPQILILDNTLACLPRGEAEPLITRLREALPEVCLVVMARVPQEVQFLPRVLVLHNGSIVADGTHAALVAQPGPYHYLFAEHAT